MRKKFISKRRKKRNFKVPILFIIMVLVLVGTFKFLEKTDISIDDKRLVKILLKSYEKKKMFNIDVPKDPVFYLQNNYIEKTFQEIKEEKPEIVNKEPLIYIYNSHQSEEYKASTFAEHDVRPSVMMVDYILEEVFQKNSYPTIVEERRISEVLANNNWKYVYSYRASRVFLEDAIVMHPSLKYFIDVHRDSLEHARTYININGKDYARTIFLIGLENEGYEESLAFTEKINNKLNEKYPGLSKGIYKKGGPTVNGVYNQDFSNRTILIEIGGYESTTTEVLNSTLAFAECFLEVINEGEN